MILAAYKGTRPGVSGWYNRLGRYIAQGPYSHTELILEEYGGVSWSASYMDGGVRPKMIGYSTVDAWDFFKLPKTFSEQQAMDYNQAHAGWKYDIKGNFRFGIAIAVPSDSKHKEFCSENNLGALGIPDSYKYDPCLAVSLLKYLGATQMDKL